MKKGMVKQIMKGLPLALLILLSFAQVASAADYGYEDGDPNKGSGSDFYCKATSDEFNYTRPTLWGYLTGFNHVGPQQT